MGFVGRMVLGVAGGAAAAYLLSPDAGARRRALLRDAVGSRARRLLEFSGKAGRDLAQRASGARAQLAVALGSGEVPDWRLEQRVRSRLGREVSHPRSLEVEAHDGEVMLSGPILRHEADRAIAAARSVRGVRDVVDRLERHETGAGVPALQGGAERRARPELLQENWSPATRLGAGALGGTLAVAGARTLLRGDGVALAVPAVLAGSTVLVRVLTNRPLRQAFALGGARRSVELQKTLEIAAPVPEVFALWSRLENLPRFMDHVLEVRTGAGGRSHWKVRSAAGTDVEWDAEITELVPERVLAWKSLPGSPVRHAGIVRFDPLGPRRMRIDVRLSYAPPAGIVGHGVASLFGVDPKRVLDEDLLRMKSLLEEGKTTVRGETVTREELVRPAPLRR